MLQKKRKKERKKTEWYIHFKKKERKKEAWNWLRVSGVALMRFGVQTWHTSKKNHCSLRWSLGEQWKHVLPPENAYSQLWPHSFLCCSPILWQIQINFTRMNNQFARPFAFQPAAASPPEHVQNVWLLIWPSRARIVRVGGGRGGVVGWGWG